MAAARTVPKLSITSVFVGFARCLATCGRGRVFSPLAWGCRVTICSAFGKVLGSNDGTESEVEAGLGAVFSLGRNFFLCLP